MKLNSFCWKNKLLTIVGRIYGLFLFAIAIVRESVFNVRSHNFGIVNDGEIYRSAQPSQQFLNRLIKKHRIKTIVTFISSIPDFEIKAAELHSIKIIHLKMSVLKGPSEKDVKEFLKVVNDKTNYPTLVHCSVGSDRTGLMVAIKRIEIDGWSVKEAKRELVYYRNAPLFIPMPSRFLEKYYNPR